MFSNLIETLGDFIQRGGWVMYPLMVISIIALTLIFERCWFWLTTNSPTRRRRLHRVAQHLRRGEKTQAMTLIEDDRSIYGTLVRALIESNGSEAVIKEAVEYERPRIQRFMTLLGTFITAAPMLGILGTVTGIIKAFRILSETDMVTDPTAIGAGIAEALLTTVIGLVVGLVVLFPYNWYRSQIESTLGLAEALVAAAQQNDPAPEAKH